MIEKVFNRVEIPFPNNKIEIFSDGNDDYTYVLPEYYAHTCINYGQLVKIREKGRVIDKEKRIIYGNPESTDIETTNIENFNGILRERIGRLLEDLAEHAEKMNEYLITNVGLSPIECDELWSMVKKNRRKLSTMAQFCLLYTSDAADE